MLEPLATCLSALLKASWQGGVLILLVLAAQWAFGRRLVPRWRYGLWLLVLIRLALPWTTPSPVSMFNLLNLTSASASSVAANPVPDDIDSAAVPSTTVTSTKPSMAVTANPFSASPRLNALLAWLLGLWFTGATLLTVYLLVTQFRFSKRFVGRRPLMDQAVLNLLEDCKQQMGVHVAITLVETRHVGSPALFGFLRPRLLLPEGLTQSFSHEELRHVFLHELGHIKRHDILAGWLMAGLQILHWFNPLVWLASYRMRADRELACDALALAYAREDENQAYGRTIIKLLDSFGRSEWAPSLAGTVENKHQLKERIAMIAAYKKSNRGLALAVAVFAALGLVSLTDAEPSTSQLGKQLIGKWIAVGAPGHVGEAPAIGGTFKLLTETNWVLTLANPDTGDIIYHHGGTWKLKGDEYSETVDFANQSTSNLVHHTFKFKLKLDGDMLTLVGVGNPWKEVWQRAKSDAPKPLPADTIPQGKWRGTEPGNGNGGESTMTLQGSNLEFHGANTNEWYKATFTIYDTTPGQIVVRIKDCPMPQYVGRPAYAIYKLQDGTLTITGNEPGDPTVPAGFDAAGARKLIFKQE